MKVPLVQTGHVQREEEIPNKQGRGVAFSALRKYIAVHLERLVNFRDVRSSSNVSLMGFVCTGPQKTRREQFRMWNTLGRHNLYSEGNGRRVVCL